MWYAWNDTTNQIRPTDSYYLFFNYIQYFAMIQLLSQIQHPCATLTRAFSVVYVKITLGIPKFKAIGKKAGSCWVQVSNLTEPDGRVGRAGYNLGNVHIPV